MSASRGNLYTIASLSERDVDLSSTTAPGAARPTGSVNPWLVLGVIGTGNLVSSLLGSSVNVNLPDIRAAFSADMAVVEWVVTAFMLTTASLLIIFGRLGDMFGHKRIYTSGYAVFTIGCLACGLAPGIGYLIAGRVLQAVGAAMIMSVAAALTTAAFPPEKRGQVLGIQSAAVYTGLSLGPTFGGFVSSWLGWQWVFLILAPVGAFCFILASWLLPKTIPRGAQGFDLAGGLLFIGAMSSLLAVLSQGSRWGWGSPFTLGTLAAALLMAGLFVWVQLRVKAPMIDFTMFRNRIFTSGVGAAVLNYMMGATLIFLLPFYLRELRGFEPHSTGMMMSAQAVMMVAVAPISGFLSDRFGSQTLAPLGIFLQGLALFTVTRLGLEAAPWQIVFTLALMGLGVGLFTSPNNSAIMGNVPPGRTGVAASMVAAARTTGMVLGVATAGAVFRGLQASYLSLGLAASTAFLQALSGALYVGIGLSALGIMVALVRRP